MLSLGCIYTNIVYMKMWTGIHVHVCICKHLSSYCYVSQLNTRESDIMSIWNSLRFHIIPFCEVLELNVRQSFVIPNRGSSRTLGCGRRWLCRWMHLPPPCEAHRTLQESPQTPGPTGGCEAMGNTGLSHRLLNKQSLRIISWLVRGLETSLFSIQELPFAFKSISGGTIFLKSLLWGLFPVMMPGACPLTFFHPLSEAGPSRDAHSRWVPTTWAAPSQDRGGRGPHCGEVGPTSQHLFHGGKMQSILLRSDCVCVWGGTPRLLRVRRSYI